MTEKLRSKFGDFSVTLAYFEFASRLHSAAAGHDGSLNKRFFNTCLDND